jgi:hypothetical protein
MACRDDQLLDPPCTSFSLTEAKRASSGTDPELSRPELARIVESLRETNPCSGIAGAGSA